MENSKEDATRPNDGGGEHIQKNDKDDSRHTEEVVEEYNAEEYNSDEWDSGHPSNDGGEPIQKNGKDDSQYTEEVVEEYNAEEYNSDEWDSDSQPSQTEEAYDISSLPEDHGEDPSKEVNGNTNEVVDSNEDKKDDAPQTDANELSYQEYSHSTLDIPLDPIKEADSSHGRDSSQHNSDEPIQDNMNGVSHQETDGTNGGLTADEAFEKANALSVRERMLELSQRDIFIPSLRLGLSTLSKNQRSLSCQMPSRMGPTSEVSRPLGADHRNLSFSTLGSQASLELQPPTHHTPVVTAPSPTPQESVSEMSLELVPPYSSAAKSQQSSEVSLELQPPVSSAPPPSEIYQKTPAPAPSKPGFTAVAAGAPDMARIKQNMLSDDSAKKEPPQASESNNMGDNASSLSDIKRNMMAGENQNVTVVNPSGRRDSNASELSGIKRNMMAKDNQNVTVVNPSMGNSRTNEDLGAVKRNMMAGENQNTTVVNPSMGNSRTNEDLGAVKRNMMAGENQNTAVVKPNMGDTTSGYSDIKRNMMERENQTTTVVMAAHLQQREPQIPEPTDDRAEIKSRMYDNDPEMGVERISDLNKAVYDDELPALFRRGAESSDDSDVDKMKKKEKMKDSSDSDSDDDDDDDDDSEALPEATPFSETKMSVAPVIAESVIPFHRRFRKHLICGGVFFLVIVVVVAAVVSSSTKAVIEEQLDGPDKTQPPSPAPVPLTREEKIEQVIFEVSPASAEVDSPESKALDWILWDDEFKLEYDDPSLIQRYIMTLFYYATGGDKYWYDCAYDPDPLEVNCTVYDWYMDMNYTYSRFLTPTHECTWYGVACFGPNEDPPNEVFALLYYEFNNLTGTLPKELSQLQSMEKISVAAEGGNLGGTIPNEFAQWTELNELTIAGNAFTGTIPAGIFEINALRYINFGQNSLSGTLPETLGSATSLELLFVFENGLTGTIPEGIGRLPFMSFLDTSGNKFTGSLPSSLSNMTWLLEIRANDNMLTGPIPEGLGNIWDLEFLTLNNNQLTGTLPYDMFYLNRLYVLEVINNLLTGTIPVTIQNLTSVQAIAFKENMLTGTVPPEVGYLPDLRSFRVHSNELTGTMPASVCNQNLRLLYSDCTEEDGVTKIYCPCCTHCCSPETGICRKNIIMWPPETDEPSLPPFGNATDPPFGDEITASPTTQATAESTTEDQIEPSPVPPPVQTPTASLTPPPTKTPTVELSRSDAITARILDVSPDATTANTYSNLAMNWIISEDGLQVKSDDPLLIQRYLLALLYYSTGGDNWFKCAFDPNVSKCTALNYDDGQMWTYNRFLTPTNECSWYGVGCSENNEVTRLILKDGLAGSLPTELSELKTLAFMSLAGNKLVGGIPDGIFDLTALRQLILAKNSFSGTISGKLGDLSLLEQLDLSENGLTGSMPHEIGNLQYLAKLNLELNSFSGSLPSSIGNLSNLGEFKARSNNFAGSLPQEVGNMANLVTIDLRRNKLTGFLPLSIGNLTKLGSLWLGNNKLSGTIPREIGTLENLGSLWLDNNGFAGSLPDEFYGLSALRYVFLSKNKLSGTLSDKIGNLALLNGFLLNQNIFSGTIPSSLGNATNLSNLWMQINGFTGTMPSTICDLQNMKKLYSDCALEDNKMKVECSCCTHCCTSTGVCTAISL